ncbi:dnaJ homolog subfamily B member 9 [Solea solea]|uniref:dnaJ homolog subfamily B member 9 n=1 Tax=Solea solea TaxID=90069 RepID=UPI00272BE07C|nr:dnaJ homolog subfamily B member 9 [Solea solea]
MEDCVVLLLCFAAVSLLAAAATETSSTYYDTLNVEPTATDVQIKKAFRELAVKYHPDKSKRADAEKTFREITEAYKVLSNKEKRRFYDIVGHESFLHSQGSVDAEHETHAHFTFSNFVYDFGENLFEKSQFHWNFAQDWEEEEEEEDDDDPYEHYTSEAPSFSLFYGDGDEFEDEYTF